MINIKFKITITSFIIELNKMLATKYQQKIIHENVKRQESNLILKNLSFYLDKSIINVCIRIIIQLNKLL